MLLRSIDLNIDRTCIVFSKQVLDRIEIMLSHITQSSSVVIPVTSEFGVHPFRIVWFEWSRAEPEIIIQLFRNRHWLKLVETAPVEFPVETGYAAYRNLKWPSQDAAINYFLQRLHRCLHSIKLITEPEPGIQPEHTSRSPDRLDNFYSFTDSPGHWFFTPYILSGLCRCF